MSKVTASVPARTGGKDRYLQLPGLSGNNASTPDSVANSITGNIDIRVKAALVDWTPAADNSLFRKTNTVTSYGLKVLTNARLEFIYSTDGSTMAYPASSAVVPFADGSTGWVRATMNVDNGGTSKVVTFYTSSDGITWNQLGTPISTSQAGYLYDGPESLAISPSATGKIYYAEFRNGINGTFVNKFDPNEAAAQSPSSWTSSTGETWTVTAMAQTSRRTLRLICQLGLLKVYQLVALLTTGS